MDGLRDTARDLERKHNALLARVQERLAVVSIAGGAVDPRVQALERRLQTAREQAEALKQQNLQFLDEIGDRIKREDRMEGLFRELMVCPLRRPRCSPCGCHTTTDALSLCGIPSASKTHSSTR